MLKPHNEEPSKCSFAWGSRIKELEQRVERLEEHTKCPPEDYKAVRIKHDK